MTCIMCVLHSCVLLFGRCFADEIELSGVQIDVALRKFQSYFRMPVSLLRMRVASDVAHCDVTRHVMSHNIEILIAL